ncbi:MAG: DUF1566 domain-containing protein, partial [Leptospiraceae bacterium]|nr:DUF1566 domain-containing protein [Leptospiraceae bacterium]
SKSIHIYGIAGKTLKFKAFSGGSSSTTVTAIYSYPPLKTGQTVIYGSGSDDGAYQTGVTRSYTDNGDGTILDNATGITWQKCSRGQNNDSTCSGTATTTDWSTASSYCNSLSLTGKTWTLPSLFELATIIDFGGTPKTISSVFFPSTINSFYWTSISSASDTLSAYNFSFGSGILQSSLKSSSGYYVRCKVY